MFCYVHGNEAAVGTCVGCGKFVCAACCTEVAGKNYCKGCVGDMLAKKNTPNLQGVTSAISGISMEKYKSLGVPVLVGMIGYVLSIFIMAIGWAEYRRAIAMWGTGGMFGRMVANELAEGAIITIIFGTVIYFISFLLVGISMYRRSKRLHEIKLKRYWAIYIVVSVLFWSGYWVIVSALMTIIGMIFFCH